MRVADLEELLSVVGDERFTLRARVTALLAEACFAAFDFERGLAVAKEASRLAEAAGDDEVLAFALFVLGLQHQGRFELEESERCFTESVARGDFAGGAWSRGRLRAPSGCGVISVPRRRPPGSRKRGRRRSRTGPSCR